MQKERYITIKRASKLLGITKATLRNWDRAGKLKTERHPINGFRVYLKSEIKKLLAMNISVRPRRKPNPKLVRMSKAKPRAAKPRVAKPQVVKPLEAKPLNLEEVYSKGDFITFEEAVLYLGVTSEILDQWVENERIGFSVNPESGRRMFSKRKLRKILRQAKP